MRIIGEGAEAVTVQERKHPCAPEQPVAGQKQAVILHGKRKDLLSDRAVHAKPAVRVHDEGVARRERLPAVAGAIRIDVAER